MTILALSRPPFDIGAVRTGARDGEGVWRAEQRFVLVREVAFQDYFDFLSEQLSDPSEVCRCAEMCRYHHRYFEIATD